jgi:hypothetical protein
VDCGRPPDGRSVPLECAVGLNSTRPSSFVLLDPSSILWIPKHTFWTSDRQATAIV